MGLDCTLENLRRSSCLDPMQASCVFTKNRGVTLKDFDHKEDGSMLLVLMISPLLLFEEGADQVSPRCACYNTKEIREIFINFRRLPATCNSEAPRTTIDNLLSVLCLRLYSPRILRSEWILGDIMMASNYCKTQAPLTKFSIIILILSFAMLSSPFYEDVTEPDRNQWEICKDLAILVWVLQSPLEKKKEEEETKTKT